nr:MAG TPA_asm: hypothetical protein [Caudoviricetes sp.]
MEIQCTCRLRFSYCTLKGTVKGLSNGRPF